MLKYSENALTSILLNRMAEEGISSHLVSAVKTLIESAYYRGGADALRNQMEMRNGNQEKVVSDVHR